MPVSPYLFFNGNCAEAMRFYEKTLGGTLELMTYGQTPEGQAPPNLSPDLIMHASLELPNGLLMASDDMTGEYRGMSGFTISIDYPSLDEARRIYDILAEGGKVWMPFGKTFWSEGFGMFADRFGTPWMVSVVASS